LGSDPVPVDEIRRAWRAGRGPIRPEHARALETAYLGETNLPWYTENLAHHFAAAAPQLLDFFHRWVAEEDQHGRAFETYLLFDRAVPAGEMLAAKSAMLRAGREEPAGTPFRIMVYTSIQELSTRVFYARLAAAVGEDDPILGELLRRIQADESLHLAFYRDAVKAALAQQPALAAEVVDEIERFREPVTVLPDYERRKEAIWQAGICNLEVFRQQVIAPLVAYWDIADEAVDRRWRP
jgi:acyl-[acyl-carrier-protein] desaturase